MRGVLDLCADPQKFTRVVDKELRQIWKASTGFRPDAREQIAAIDRKVKNIRRAVEEGLNDANWANTRPRELHAEGEALARPPENRAAPFSMTPRLRWTIADRRTSCFGRVAKLSASYSCVPEVSISYRLPEPIMNGLVAGGGFEPPTFGL
jgi:hypothetical protein